MSKEHAKPRKPAEIPPDATTGAAETPDNRTRDESDLAREKAPSALSESERKQPADWWRRLPDQLGAQPPAAITDKAPTGPATPTSSPQDKQTKHSPPNCRYEWGSDGKLYCVFANPSGTPWRYHDTIMETILRTLGIDLDRIDVPVEWKVGGRVFSERADVLNNLILQENPHNKILQQGGTPLFNQPLLASLPHPEWVIQSMLSQLCNDLSAENVFGRVFDIEAQITDAVGRQTRLRAGGSPIRLIFEFDRLEREFKYGGQTDIPPARRIHVRHPDWFDQEPVKLAAGAGQPVGREPQAPSPVSQKGKWTEERIAHLRSLLKMGLFYPRIGEELGVKEGAIRAAAKKYLPELREERKPGRPSHKTGEPPETYENQARSAKASANKQGPRQRLLSLNRPGDSSNSPQNRK